MSTLRTAATEYLAMRRALGFKLSTQGSHLMSFIAYCENNDIDHVTADAAITWATETVTASTDGVYQARRLDTVRIFARHMRAIDEATEVPPVDVLPHRYRRVPPFLYSPGQIAALMAAAGMLAPPLRAATWETMIGFLAVTGMRKSEACRITRDDVDLVEATVLIRNSKFGKSRQIYLHPTTVAALRGYADIRDRLCPTPAADTFFINTRGRSISPTNTSATFTALRDDAGITAPPGRRAPRLHDLRHVFTITTMLDWYRSGVDVQARLPLLSTWMGHIDPKSTYWYQESVPELLAYAAARLEAGTPEGGVS